MRALEAILDKNGTDLIGLTASDFVNAQVLAAGVAETLDVPVGAKYVLFSSTEDFYVKFNGTAAIPEADVADGTASILNPGLRSLDRVISIGLISSFICTVTMEFYS
jgi:hypothetical protein